MSDFVSGFWNMYVVVIVLGSILACAVLLYMQGKAKFTPGKTMGHVWDETLEEYNNPMPNWWRWWFYLTVVIALAYLALYPGLWNFAGTFRWTMRGQYDAEMKKAQEVYGPKFNQYLKQDVAAVAADPEAREMGQRLFVTYCAQCHGSDARGAKGFVTDFDPLLANVFVPERELDKLRAKQKASITADALPDRKFEAIIDRISPTVDPKTGTFKVTVAVSDPTRRLKPGMFGRIDIVYDVRNNTLLLPRSAVIQEDAESAVFVIKDGVATRRTVSVGYANNGNIEVTAGIKAGDPVVTVGQGSLKEGSKVNVVGGAKATQTEVAAEEPGKKGGQA